MKYFIIAGEASGDLHGSNLMRELKQVDTQATFMFLGGDLMQAQGGTLVKHYRDMAFMGFIMVLLNARKVLQNIKICKQRIIEFQPDVLILIDYPGFNLRIAKFVKEQQVDIPVFYYISPKIWAWKEHRIKSIKKYIDKMFTILPFETDFYAKHNYPVHYVGNPSVDSIAFRLNKEEDFASFTKRNNLNEKPIIALLAGSRRQEIKGCLPTMANMASLFPEYQFVVGGAPSVEPQFYSKILGSNNVQVVYGQTYDLLQQAHAAIVNSGTATLETALFKVPQVVVYHWKLGFLMNILQQLVLKVKYISLVNLIYEGPLVKELIAGYFTPQNLQKELILILNPTYRKKLQNGYNEISQKLGKPGAAKKSAATMWELLKSF